MHLRGLHRHWRCPGSGRSVARAIERDRVGAMLEPVDGGCAKQFVVGKGLVPFVDRQVAGDEDRQLLGTLSDHLVQVVVLR